ncbi:MAG: hypothetical protein KDD66_06340 [Bdellovibrionales bacterium]|nr:hypothetical protein [Bdellovibrionales bacterium]
MKNEANLGRKRTCEVGGRSAALAAPESQGLPLGIQTGIHDERGATLIEWSCMTALLGLALIASIGFVKINSENTFLLASQALTLEQVQIARATDSGHTAASNNPDTSATSPTETMEKLPEVAPAYGGGNEEIIGIVNQAAPEHSSGNGDEKHPVASPPASMTPVYY